MKRLRKQYGSRIRFFHCGEYGDEHGRPHYHTCLFNFDFPDKKHCQTTKAGHKLYASEQLMGTKLFEEQYPELNARGNIKGLWPYGKALLGDVTFESAAYVARYIMKKITGDKAEQYYEHITQDGEIINLKPEYITMSRNPGIASAWFKKFHTDCYPKDYITVNGKKCRPPKYYDQELDKIDPALIEQIKDIRVNSFDQNHPDNTLDRMEKIEECTKRRIKKLVRNHDKE